MHKKIKFRCIECGYEWISCACSVLYSKYGCPECTRRHTSESQLKNQNEFESELKEINSDI